MNYYIGRLQVAPYLEHFGIQGMKWGVRRFQNVDGMLTSEGKTRYKVASKREIKTLNNLKAMKKDKIRLGRMSARQRQRLDSDIDFYKKRLKGEVKRKNILSRTLDLDRSRSLENRVKRSAAWYGADAVTKTAMSATMSKLSTGKMNLALNAGNAFMQSASSAASVMLIEELYSKAVGRY